MHLASPFVFDPGVLHEITRSVVGVAREQMAQTIAARVADQYPGHVEPPSGWIFSCAGGCLYSFSVLHASLTEYLLIFGTPVGTQGHTGRHTAAIWDFVIDGELWYFDESNPLEREVHGPGDSYHLPAGRSQGLAIPERAWVLEYARGFIPGLLPFGLADALTSALDYRTAYRTLAIYSKFYLPYLGRLASGRARLS